MLSLDDLSEGMELTGRVLNVVDFGAFVDVGLKDSGLVHISRMATRFIKCPHEVVAVGDIVTVWVLGVDRDRRRVSLTMIKPGAERDKPARNPNGQQPRKRKAKKPRGPKAAPAAPTAAQPETDQPMRGFDELKAASKEGEPPADPTPGPPPSE